MGPRPTKTNKGASGRCREIYNWDRAFNRAFTPTQTRQSHIRPPVWAMPHPAPFATIAVKAQNPTAPPPLRPYAPETNPNTPVPVPPAMPAPHAPRLPNRDYNKGQNTSLNSPPGPLPVQAPTGLVQAYRDLATQLVLRLVADGRESAPAIAEHARQTLLTAHPSLDGLSFSGRPPRAVVADATDLTGAIAALINELLWTATDQEGNGPEEMLRELTHERRHLFQSAGLFDRISWKLS